MCVGVRSEGQTYSIGSDIDGEYCDYSGASVSKSSDGKRVAIGDTAGGNLSAGRVRIYDWDESNRDWIQVGFDIDAGYDWSSTAVAMSGN